LTTLIRSRAVSQNRLVAIADRLRGLLGSAQLPLEIRAEAWAAHAEACLLLGATGELRVAVRYAVKHLASLEPAGARVASVLSRASGMLLQGSAVAVEGLCSVEWPLRAAGLAAAAAAAVRPDAPAPIREVARCAVDAFREESSELSSSPPAGGWSADPSRQRRKRRRLLLELAALPDEASSFGE
ncbi:unnamed protein product, partial [Polarella glacialis]